MAPFVVPDKLSRLLVSLLATPSVRRYSIWQSRKPASRKFERVIPPAPLQSSKMAGHDQTAGNEDGAAPQRGGASPRDRPLPDDGAEGTTEPFRTIADLPSTSTSHITGSPGSRPSTVATGCGTVVLRESELGEARKALLSNVFGIVLTVALSTEQAHNMGLYRGRRIDLMLKYHRQYRPIDRPMTGARGPWDHATEIRAVRLLSTHKEAVRANGRLRFQVLSADGGETYEVVADEDGWSCTCPGWTDRRLPCPHIVGVVIWLDPDRPAIRASGRRQARPTYRQEDYGAYDRARQLEHQVFDRYLWDLLGSLPDRVRPAGKRGRPAIPLRTQVLVAVRKVHLKEDSRGAHGLLVALNQDGKGILPRVPNYSCPSRFFNQPKATEILLALIERSGLVLREIEDGGTVAIDSSGFSTSTMGSYFTEKYDPERRHQFVKAHLAIGVKTHVALTVRVTDEHGADSPQFIPLLERVAELGHTPDRVAADKAHLGRGNLEATGSLGIDPFIPFKSNSRGLSKGSPMWNRKYHEFQLKRDEFDAAYHQRSNVESVFSAIKRTLNESLLSRTTLAKFNELLAKILAYNVCVVIRQSELRGLETRPTSYIPKLPGSDPSVGVAS